MALEQEQMDAVLSDLFSKGTKVENTQQTTQPVSQKKEANVELLESAWDSIIEQKQNEVRQASWGDVFKSGGVRAGAGPAQGILSLLEMGGALEPGSTAQFTRDVLNYEKLGEMDIIKTLTRDTLANALPIAAEVAATKGVSFPVALKRSAMIGGSSGFFNFIEDPEQAAATSVARMFNTGIGSALSPLFLAGGIAVGRGVDFARGVRGPTQVAGPDIIPPEDVVERGMNVGQAARERGITVTPGGAMQDPLTMIKEGQAQFISTPTKRVVGDTMASNVQSVDAMINDFYRTLMPEGESIGTVVNDLFRMADDDLVPLDLWKSNVLKIPDRDVPDYSVRRAISDIKSDPASRQKWEAYEKGSIGQLNMIRRRLQGKIDTAEGGITSDGSPAEILMDSKNRIADLGKDFSPAFSEALAVSQRELLGKEIAADLIKWNIEKPGAIRFLDGALTNKPVYDKIFTAIGTIKDPTIRKEALAKMNLLKTIIPAAANFEKTAGKLLGVGEDAFEARGKPEAAVLYSFMNFLKGNNDEKLVEFILSPDWSSGTLREIAKNRNKKPEEFIRGLSIWAEEIASGRASPDAPESETTSEDTTMLDSAPDKQKAKAYQNLERAGKLETLRLSNPRAYKSLKDAYTKQAIA
jgi:hypothetical protein